ncbi:MAG: polyketide synthase, partial [Gemmatimonadales bacterium]
MAEPTTDGYRRLLERALAKLEELEGKLALKPEARREPIAVIGAGVRFPGGVDDLRSFWRLLHDGIDPVSEVPPDRWDVEALYDPDPDAPGKTYARWGGFLTGVDRFDPAFFGISPREAKAMDPQQRLLLEVSWEALERAGYASPSTLGSKTGVYVGMVATDYASLSHGDLTGIDTYFGTGISRSIAAGRLSYLLGLHGPNMAIDTACSSSLVSVHLACQSLRTGESDMALAGGVNLILAPDGSVSTARARMASFTGRCRAFDASADGYVRAEGCAMVLLKRLPEAIRDGDQVMGVIRGSAINQDGRSNGITAPSGNAQAAVIRLALADGGIDPAEVGFLEAHGTGTPLGDPIEMGALAEVFGGSHTSERPLMVGSVKTNIGHTEATAGMASLIKVLLAFEHGTIPPHLHLREPNPRIPWNELPVTVPTTRTPWERTVGRPRVAGVSSYGFSGTNAHVVVAEPPPPESPTNASTGLDRSAHLLALSARDGTALGELAERFRAALEETAAPLGDVAFAANSGRAHFTERLALVADTTTNAAAILSGPPGDHRPGLLRGTVSAGDPPRVAFLFTGQGAQRV